MKVNFVLFCSALFVFNIVCPGETHAYVGPGVGLTLAGSLVGMGFAIFSAVGAILLWPLRRWVKRRKTNSETSEEINKAKEMTPGI